MPDISYPVVYVSVSVSVKSRLIFFVFVVKLDYVLLFMLNEW